MKPPDPWLRSDIIRPLVRYRLRAIGFLLLVVASAALGVTLCPRMYRSESRLFVRLGRENATLDPTATTGHTIALNESRETEINSIVEQIGSRAIFEKTLERIDPEAAQRGSESREQALVRLIKAVAITSPRRSTVVTLTCKGTSPEEARTTLATLVDVYLDEHMRINRTSGSYEFFAGQSESLKSQLDAAEAALRDAKNAFAFSSLDERRKALELQVSDVETQLRQVASALSGSQAKLAALENQLRTMPQSLASQLVGGMPNDGLGGMREELFRLRSREKELLSRCTPEHPHVIAIRDHVQSLEAALKNEEPATAQITSAVVAQETANRDSLAAQERSLTGQLRDLRVRIAQFNQQDVTISAMARQVKQLESRYLAYQADSEQARIGSALQADRITNVSIIQPATLEPTPVSPRKTLILALALLLGGCGGIGLCYVSEHLASPSPRRVPSDGDVRRHHSRHNPEDRVPPEETALAKSQLGNGQAGMHASRQNE